MNEMNWEKLVPNKSDFKLISLEDIEPNPFRDMKRYPIDEEKLDALKASFQNDAPWKSSHWMVREHPTKKGKYQLHFGHHRYQALKDLGCKEWRFAVENVDDATMLKRMANENGETYANDADVAIETIYAIKKFLETELQKYPDYKTFMTSESAGHNFPLIDSMCSFRNTKKCLKPGGFGVGKETIYAFLGGDGVSQWSFWTIRTSLEVIRQPDKDPKVSKKAMSEFPTMSTRREFQLQVKKHGIPKDKQVNLAKKLKDKGKRQIQKAIRAAAPKTKDISQQMEEEFEGIVNQARLLEEIVLGFKAKCNDLEVKTLDGRGVEAGWFVLSSCVKEIVEFMKSFNGDSNET